MLRLPALALLILLLFSGCSSTAPATTSDGATLSAALKELDALAAPKGVSPQRFGELKQALRSALLARGASKFASAAPKNAAGAVSDLALTVQGGGQVNLAWTYRNKGDYDQNRQVTIGDLSALGANLGKTTASPDWLSKAIACDGDGNGEVNIADITPIGANLFATVAGYKVQITTTPGNAGSWTELADVAFDTSAAPGGSALRVFSQSVAATPQAWYRVVAYDGSDLGASSNEVQYALSAPDITGVSPLTGDAGTAASFSAVNTGGTPSTWAWDFGGGATPDTSSLAAPQETLGVAGSYNASVTVSNAAGSDTFDFTLDVTNPAPPVIDDVQPQGGSEGAQFNIVATISGGAVQTYAWDFGGGATPNTDSNVSPFITLGTAGIYPASLTVTNAGGSDTFDFNLSVTPGINDPPVASFTANPQTGNPGDLVDLDASASSDSDGSIVKYEWDLDGDGIFELEGGVVENTTLPSPAGTVDVSLRVTDDDGATAEDTKTLSSLSAGWNYSIIPTSGATSQSIFIVDGNPAIAFYDTKLYFIRATDPQGSSWGVVHPVDTTPLAGTDCSLAVVHGNPAIAYKLLDDLMFVRALDADGGAWGVPTTVTSPAGAQPFYCSMKIATGFPAIAYYNPSSNNLNFVRASDQDGTGWNSPKTPDGNIGVGQYTSMAIVGGKLCISYQDTMNGGLKFVHAADGNGDNWDSPLFADPDSNFVLHTSIADVNGNPAIAYAIMGVQDLRFVRATDPDGTAWGSPQTLDSSGNTGNFPALAIVGGVPCVAFRSDSSLAYIAANDPTGISWGALDTVEPTTGVTGICLAAVGGGSNPGICYYNVTDGLKYAVRFP